MKRNGKPHTNGATAPEFLANLVIPGVEFQDREYARLKLRLDCYEDVILGQKYDQGQGMGFYALDPLDVMTALAGLTIGTPLLPPGCLYWYRLDGGERLAIYAGPQVWTVNVAFAGQNDDPKRKRGKRQTWRVPMPGLIWIGQGGSYRLYAVKGSEWPLAETELFKAPCPNVRGDHGTCQGDVKFPAASAATIWPALRMFFESDFNNHLANGKSKRFNVSILSLWKELAEAEAEVWPEEDLVSLGTTLGRVM